jgi:hypothetical protein
MAMRFGNGNANMVTVNNFLSRLWSLIDNQFGLKWQIVACRQQSAFIVVRVPSNLSELGGR